MGNGASIEPIGVSGTTTTSSINSKTTTGTIKYLDNEKLLLHKQNLETIPKYVFESYVHTLRYINLR